MSQKRILMITNSLYPNLNANSEIVYRLSEELRKTYDCRVTILGVKTSGNALESDDKYNSVAIKSLSEHYVITNGTSNKIVRWIKLLMHPKAFCFAIRKGKENEYCLEYQRAIKREIKNANYDIIVGFTEPSIIPKALSHINMDIPYITYKLDPWSTHYLRIKDKSARDDEFASDIKASAIIITNFVYDSVKDTMGEFLLKKTKVLELPNIKHYQKAEKKNLFDKNQINCVFAGGLYKDIRNPEYTFKLFREFKDKRIVLHIFGHVNGGDVFSDNLPDNVIIHGRVSSDEAISYMLDADVLVNIGNTINNQMPSKILTYISMGKPILNIIKIKDCPSLRYTNKYPLSFNLFETKKLQEQDVEKAQMFCIEHAGQYIDYDRIKNMYNTCTVEYVGRELYNTIDSCINIKE